MNRKSLAAAAVLGVAGVSLAALQVRAGGDKIVFPENFAKGVMYATVDRPDNKQYREFYINAEAADAESSLKLSLARASAVKSHLVTEYQIDSRRLEAKGLGDTKPAMGNTTPEGRASNRRFELARQ